LGSACSLIITCLLLSLPANALFLAGQTEQGGEISVLCEGQGQAFLSLPTGELRALALDSDFQAKFLPASSGPYTFQCGNETKTIAVSFPRGADSGAFSSQDGTLLAAGAAFAFVAVLLIAAKIMPAPCTLFSKSEKNGRVKLCIRAGEDLREIMVTDPQGGEKGAPLQLVIPHLPKGAAWAWEYEQEPGGQLLSARLVAKCAKGGISLISSVEDGGKTPKQEAGRAERRERKLQKHVP